MHELAESNYLPADERRSCCDWLPCLHRDPEQKAFSSFALGLSFQTHRHESMSCSILVLWPWSSYVLNSDDFTLFNNCADCSAAGNVGRRNTLSSCRPRANTARRHPIPGCRCVRWRVVLDMNIGVRLCFRTSATLHRIGFPRHFCVS